MTEADKIVAAIFAASKCGEKAADHATYLDAYDRFIDLMTSRKKEKHPPLNVSDEAVARMSQGKKRNT